MNDVGKVTTMVLGKDALVLANDGSERQPAGPDEWDEWVAAGRTRNFLLDDPILDWLDRYGRSKGFTPDDELASFDPRTDFVTFITDRGAQFEEKVVELVSKSVPVVRVGTDWHDSQDLGRAEETFEMMRAAEPIIHQAVLRNADNRTYGMADLLVRSDVLARLIPGGLTAEEAAIAAPALGPDRRHYRVVDIKFTTLDLRQDGQAGSRHRKHLGQVWVYNQALGRMQGYTPPASYLLGRAWESASERGASCLERLAAIRHDATLGRAAIPLADAVLAALEWVRRMRRDGASWEVLPVPTVPELYPHARHREDQPWHSAKSDIADALAELTLLPGMNAERRRKAHALGVLRWEDPRANSQALDVPRRYAAQCDAVLAANRGSQPEAVLPERIVRADPEWRTPPALELYVDFETVSNLDDDFSLLPETGGQPLIFQVGCGWLDGDDWRFWQSTAKRLDKLSEGQIIDEWISHMQALLASRGLQWSDLRVVHWSHAEASWLDNAYNAARTRHPSNGWPDVPWFDALRLVAQAEPVSVRGAFAFGLKPVAKAMHAAGLIDTTWEDGPTDGLGAMVGAWWCDAEAERAGSTLSELPLMAEIGGYNEVDCRAMADTLSWLRNHR